MIKYVVGFAFSRNKTEVVLILKQKPDWQAGKLNGIGGKIEELDQSPHHAMSREFAEETGVKIPMILWHRFAVLKGIDYKAELHCFRLFTNRIYLCKSMEQEEIHPGRLFLRRRCHALRRQPARRRCEPGACRHGAARLVA